MEKAKSWRAEAGPWTWAFPREAKRQYVNYRSIQIQSNTYLKKLIKD